MNDSASFKHFDSLPPQDIIDSVLGLDAGPACLTCSFQVEDMAVLHMLRQREPEIPVIFLDTGYHFPETYAYRDRMAEQWNLNLINVVPQQSVVEQETQLGILYQSAPSRCCQLRKVEPLMDALEGYRVWFTGLRREQSPTRSNLQVVERHVLPGGNALLKVSPLAAWDWRQAWEYTIAEHINYLSLYDSGYRSIGCRPCTSIPAEGADPRSGRWSGKKLECGIHTFSRQTE